MWFLQGSWGGGGGEEVRAGGQLPMRASTLPSLPWIPLPTVTAVGTGLQPSLVAWAGARTPQDSARTPPAHQLPKYSGGGGGGGLGLPQHPQGAQAPLTVRFSNFRNRFLNFPGSFCKINRGGDTHTDMSTRGEGGSGSTWGGPGHPTAPYLPGEAQAADGSVVEPDDDGVEGEHVLVLLASGEGERVRSRQGTPTHTTPPPTPSPTLTWRRS